MVHSLFTMGKLVFPQSSTFVFFERMAAYSRLNYPETRENCDVRAQQRMCNRCLDMANFMWYISYREEPNHVGDNQKINRNTFHSARNAEED